MIDLIMIMLVEMIDTVFIVLIEIMMFIEGLIRAQYSCDDRALDDLIKTLMNLA